MDYCSADEADYYHHYHYHDDDDDDDERPGFEDDGRRTDVGAHVEYPSPSRRRSAPSRRRRTIEGRIIDHPPVTLPRWWKRHRDRRLRRTTTRDDDADATTRTARGGHRTGGREPAARGRTPPTARASPRRSPVPHPRSHASMMPPPVVQFVVVFLVRLLPYSDGVHYGPDVVDGSINNPLNKYCGINLEEAHRFCHLPVDESFPCPNGDVDCPYGLPCWSLESPCTMPPSPMPTLGPTMSNMPSTLPSVVPTDSTSPTLGPTTLSPITAVSADPRDHNFCGLGFDNLFECAVPCPNGTPNECPSGQLCYFNTPCDARLIVMEVEVDEAQAEVEAEVVEEEQVEVDAADQGGDLSNQKFCGFDVKDALENCTSHRHCPMGDECPLDQFCFVVNCFADDMPTNPPTSSPRPSVIDMPQAPSSPSPTAPPLDADDIRNFYWCGVDWGDASTRCYLPCLTGSHSECGEGEECFANVNCKGGNEDDEADEEVEVEETSARTPSPDGSTWSPTATSPPSSLAAVEDGNTIQSAERTPSPDGSTWSPTITPPPMAALALGETLLPTASPILADDMRNFFFCGKNWTDASTRCHKRCMSSFHSECDDDEECFAQADCDGILTLAPTSLSPIAPPTMSPAPTVSPASTDAPTVPAPTLPPASESPTTPYPSSMVPTISFSSLGPTISSVPTISGTPTAAEATFDTDAPVAISNSPTFVNVDDLEFDPDDPAGYFFCGTDWNNAITECLHRCPSGEGAECPDDMLCYAFTPCEGVGGKVKPTWEPTPYPISSAPTTTEEYWAEKNEEMNAESSNPPQELWTESPTPKLSYAPTEDQCRGQPCDYKGECRSELGFCGEGIVHCNSKSSWVPDCGGGGKLTSLDEDEVASDKNTVPTTSPVSLWEAWVADRDDNATGYEEEDGWYDSNGNETSHGNETGEVIIPGASWDNWAVSEWSGRSSSTKWGYSYPYTAVLLAILCPMALL